MEQKCLKPYNLAHFLYYIIIYDMGYASSCNYVLMILLPLDYHKFLLYSFKIVEHLLLCHFWAAKVTHGMGEGNCYKSTFFIWSMQSCPAINDFAAGETFTKNLTWNMEVLVPQDKCFITVNSHQNMVQNDSCITMLVYIMLKFTNQLTA